MTAFDWAVLAVVALSALAAYARGIVRSLVGLVAWVVGLVVGVAYAPALAAWFPPMASHPLLPTIVAFVLIFLAAVLAGALVAWPLTTLVHGAGLGFLDRALGAAFGLARAAVLVIAFVLVAGLTALPASDWWQNSLLARPLSDAALALKPWLPPEWGGRLDFSGKGGTPAADPKSPGKG